MRQSHTNAAMVSFILWNHGSNGQEAEPPKPNQSKSRMPSEPLQPKFSVARLRTLVHSSSSPALHKMATLASPPMMPPRLNSDTKVTGLNTLPDPRSPSPSSTLSRSNSAASNQHPDLNDEMANMSTKLVNAINHQAMLDGKLQTTKHELEQARAQIERLEAAARRHTDLISQGLLITREDADREKATLTKSLAEEQEKRAKAENEKRRGESELQDLTAALFTEANTMVEQARRETEAEQKRTEQYKNQLQDAETLLQSHQAQLQDLKAVLEKISSERDEEESNAHSLTAPSTPAVGPQDKMSRFLEASHLSPITPGSDEPTPDHPLKFSHLIHPVLREDVLAYREFSELIKSSKSLASPPTSRVSSGSFGSINVLGLGAGTASSTSPASPKFASPNGGASPGQTLQSGPNLKDTKVFKRALTEDIEPTLRLDIAPGLSWMARRTVLSSLTVGTLGIEPMPAPVMKFRGPVNACALCGENRVADQYVRRHRFRTSDAEDAQKYPLCEGCLNRVRSVCDYVAFLRMIKDGHWRAETDEDIKNAWEESVRLRERMFWQRIGGGVVPAFLQKESSAKTPKMSQDEARPSPLATEILQDEAQPASTVQISREEGQLPTTPQVSQDEMQASQTPQEEVPGAFPG